MSYEDVADKFRECARFAEWDTGRAERVIGLVYALDNLGSVRELTDLLAK